MRLFLTADETFARRPEVSSSVDESADELSETSADFVFLLLFAILLFLAESFEAFR